MTDSLNQQERRELEWYRHREQAMDEACETGAKYGAAFTAGASTVLGLIFMPFRGIKAAAAMLGGGAGLGAAGGCAVGEALERRAWGESPSERSQQPEGGYVPSPTPPTAQRGGRQTVPPK